MLDEKNNQIKDGNKALELYIVLCKAYKSISQHDQQDIKRYGLNLTEFAVLDLLYNKGPQKLQQIGERILISSGSITYVVNKLAEKAYLLRKTCEEDQRITYAEISEQGKAFYERIFPEHIIALEEAHSGLTPEETEQAIYLIKKLGLEAEKKFKNKRSV